MTADGRFSSGVRLAWEESRVEVVAALKELRAAGWQWLTLAQHWGTASKTVRRWAVGATAPRPVYLRMIRATLADLRAGTLLAPERTGWEQTGAGRWRRTRAKSTNSAA